MNAEQKQRAKDALTNCQASDMAALLQELIDMPEVLAATNPAQISSLPAGGKLVPVEPTPEMIDAWNNDDSDEFRHAYRAMLEAAPNPPALSDERIFDLIGEYKALGGASGKEARLVNLARAIEREILGEKA